MIRLATAEQQLADAVSDRDRLAAQLGRADGGRRRDRADDRADRGEGRGDRAPRGPVRRSRRADRRRRRRRPTTRSPNATTRSRRVTAPRRASVDAEQARADAELGVGRRAGEDRRAGSRAGRARSTTTDARAREIDKTLGKLRREARDASNARRTAEGDAGDSRGRARHVARSGRRTRSREYDGRVPTATRCAPHAAMLGDELAAAPRATAAAAAGSCARAAGPAPVTDEPGTGPTRRPSVSTAPTTSTTNPQPPSRRRFRCASPVGTPRARVGPSEQPPCRLRRGCPTPARAPAARGARGSRGRARPRAARRAPRRDRVRVRAESAPGGEPRPCRRAGPARRPTRRVPAHGAGRVHRPRDQQRRRLLLPPALSPAFGARARPASRTGTPGRGMPRGIFRQAS